METLKELNSVSVTAKDLIAVVETMNEEADTNDPWPVGFHAIRKLFKSDIPKAQAVHSRLTALSELLSQKNARGWSLPNPSGEGFIVNDLMFEVAATEPLILDDDGDTHFEPETFFKKVFGKATPEGKA